MKTQNSRKSESNNRKGGVGANADGTHDVPIAVLAPELTPDSARLAGAPVGVIAVAGVTVEVTSDSRCCS